MDGGVPQRVYMSRRGFIPPMVCARCMHGPFSALSQYMSAFEFPVLVLVTTTLAYNMAASSADFEWFNNVDDVDEHPIGKGPTTSSTATSSSPQTPITTTPGSSAGPFDCV